MRYWGLLLVTFCLSIGAHAQLTQDFVSKFMEQCSPKGELVCRTLSPDMMAEIIQGSDTDSEQSKEMKEILSHVKSMRVLQSRSGVDGNVYFVSATDLLKANAQRYTPFRGDAVSSVYTRRKGKTIIEIVMLSLDPSRRFLVIDITGVMDNAFLNKLTQLDK